MNVKKSLENRIRGWLPKEPTFSKASARIDSKVEQQPLVTNQVREGTVGATRFLSLQAVLWTFLAVNAVIQVNAQHHITLTSQIPWIIGGLTVGLVLSSIYTHRQLRYLARDNNVQLTNPGALFAFLVGITIICMIVVYGSAFLNLQTIESGFLTSVFFISSSTLIARYVLFRRFEKKKKIYIIQYWWRAGLFAVPQINAKSTST